LASTPETPTRTEPSPAEIESAILSALAEVRAKPIAELRDEMTQASGDLELDSREAEAVIAILETRFGRMLANVEDLEPECLPSIGTLGDLIHRRWPEGRPVATATPGSGS
jgi:acyl carrier protein